MADTENLTSVPLGNLTTVQLSRRRYKPFLRQLTLAAGDTLALSDLPAQDSDDGVYVLPKPLEDAARKAQGWSSDDQWVAALHGWGAGAVNILSLEAVLRLIELGRIKHALSEAPTAAPLSAVPIAPSSFGAAQPALPPAFQGPFDWHLECCRIPDAWKLFAASPLHRGSLPWQAIKVGHIDTGYSEHAALGWQGGGSVTVHPNLGYDFFNDDPDPRDPFLPSGNPGHGTRTSAAIAAFDPSAKPRPYYGAAPGAAIIPYRVTDSIIIDHVKRHLANAIRDAIGKGCEVISISLGGLFGSRDLANALDAAYDNGVIVICAAGNIWGEVIYPGRYNRCVTMGGVTPGDLPWANSARGKYVDLCGPAQQVRRVRPENLPPGTAATGFYKHPDGNGTSYATALCAGIAALWLAWHGKAALDAAYPEKWQRAAAFKQLLRKTRRRPEGWDTTQYGSGIVNAEALLREPLPPAASLKKARSAADVFDPDD
ncbi:MAG TPA: S8 family serine peptidase [Paucimonas sp.]|nr:S8 family serine peptidase [Paucimonas sp.]